MQEPNCRFLLLLSLNHYLQLLDVDVRHVGGQWKSEGKERDDSWENRQQGQLKQGGVKSASSAGATQTTLQVQVGDYFSQSAVIYLEHQGSYKDAALERNQGKTTPGSDQRHPRHEPTSVSLSWCCCPHQPGGKNKVSSGRSERKEIVKWWLKAGDKSTQA